MSISYDEQRGTDMERINVTRSQLPPYNEYINEIKDLWETKWITNKGEKHQELERKLCDYLKTENTSLFTNGHLALEAVLASYDLQGEVITTPFTFISTTHAIIRSGLRPVFCDVGKDFMIDVEKVESLITDKTCAILPVHVYGNVCNDKVLSNIACKYGLKLIYDAAHAFGVQIGDKGVASLGDASMFSFHATKVFNTIEGGAITTSDTKISKHLSLLKNFGITGQESVEYVGGNAKMNEFQAAMGLCNLRHIDKWIKMRKQVFEWYKERLEGVKGLFLPEEKEHIKSNYAYYPVLFDGYRNSRDEVYDLLVRNNIYSRKYFFPITNEFECVKAYCSGSTPYARHISKRILTLPMHADLSKQQVSRICDIILRY